MKHGLPFRPLSILLFLLALLIPAGTLGAPAYAPDAPEENPPYRISGGNSNGRFDALSDDNPDTHLILYQGGTVTARWEPGADAAYLYLDWGALGDGFTIEQRTAAGALCSVYPGNWRERECLIPIDPASDGLTVSVPLDSRLDTLVIYGKDDPLPEGILPWEPPLTKADLLVISTHPDDEIVMFGGLIPFCVDKYDCAVQVLYMTMQNKDRFFEARAGLRVMGLTNAPVIGPFADLEGKSDARYYKIWGGEEAIVSYLVEQLRRIRPTVVVSHDLMGEYGHGAHMVTAACVRVAVEQAGDPSCFPQSAERYGAWQVQKLYLHLFPENGILLDYDQPLAFYDGMTAMEVAARAYACHSTQRASWLRHLLKGSYNSAGYGLVCSLVGPDESCNDPFEHVSPPLREVGQENPQ